MSLDPNFLVPIASVAGFHQERENPLFHGPAIETVNIFDCTQLIFDPTNEHISQHRDFVPLQINQGNQPNIGDKVMAIGYPGVMGIKNTPLEQVVFDESIGLFGSVGTITDIFPSGISTSRPYPTFQVSGKWPSGISGGPIFNENGHVIGLISSGYYNEEKKNELSDGYSFWFQNIPILRKWFQHINPDNTGFIRGWGVVRRAPWHLAQVCSNSELAYDLKNQLGENYEVRYGSVRVGTDDFIFE